MRCFLPTLSNCCLTAAHLSLAIDLSSSAVRTVPACTPGQSQGHRRSGVVRIVPRPQIGVSSRSLSSAGSEGILRLQRPLLLFLRRSCTLIRPKRRASSAFRCSLPIFLFLTVFENRKAHSTFELAHRVADTSDATPPTAVHTPSLQYGVREPQALLRTPLIPPLSPSLIASLTMSHSNQRENNSRDLTQPKLAARCSPTHRYFRRCALALQGISDDAYPPHSPLDMPWVSKCTTIMTTTTTTTTTALLTAASTFDKLLATHPPPTPTAFASPNLLGRMQRFARISQPTTTAMEPLRCHTRRSPSSWMTLLDDGDSKRLQRSQSAEGRLRAWSTWGVRGLQTAPGRVYALARRHEWYLDSYHPRMPALPPIPLLPDACRLSLCPFSSRSIWTVACPAEEA
ncbi:hypothetical protein BJ912DRAFT_1150119 [Pholiota molesta]|nr:hypothetical protein BJ912DRAFT_1150119 [Pholiota molesta]